jgi:hypothetical protein
LLKQKGWTNFDELEGGFDVIRKTSLPKTTYVCPTSLL